MLFSFLSRTIVSAAALRRSSTWSSGVLGIFSASSLIPDAEAYKASSRTCEFRQYGDTFDETEFRDLAGTIVDILAG